MLHYRKAIIEEFRVKLILNTNSQIKIASYII